jgi:hypothetical protein
MGKPPVPRMNFMLLAFAPMAPPVILETPVPVLRCPSGRKYFPILYEDCRFERLAIRSMILMIYSSFSHCENQELLIWIQHCSLQVQG